MTNKEHPLPPPPTRDVWSPGGAGLGWGTSPCFLDYTPRRDITTAAKEPSSTSEVLVSGALLPRDPEGGLRPAPVVR